MAALLSEVAQLRVLGMAMSVGHAVKGLDRLDREPDVYIVDHDSLPDLGVGGLNELFGARARTKVVLMSLTPDPTTVVPWVKAGVRGFVTHDSDLDHLVATVRTVARGDAACSPAITAILMDAMTSGRGMYAPAQTGSLTPRERQIATLLERGLPNKDIARQLDISLATVKNHVHNILTKLELTNRGRVRTASSDRSNGSKISSPSC